MASAENQILAVASLSQLGNLARTEKAYALLTFIACSNLGAPDFKGDLQKALRWLDDLACETSEWGVVEEVNFVRDIAMQAINEAGIPYPKGGAA